MTTVKRAVTMDEDLERQARSLAGGNFSAFVSDAVARHVRLTKLSQLLRDDEAERGPVPEPVQAEVDAELAVLDASGTPPLPDRAPRSSADAE